MFLQSHPVLCLIIALTLWEAALCSDYGAVVMQVAVRSSKIPIITAQSVLKVIKQNGNAFELAHNLSHEGRVSS